MIVGFLTFMHCMLAILVIVFVLLQHGKGADMGMAVGTGVSGSLFGASGSSNFMSKLTAACIICFFMTSVALAHFHHLENTSHRTSIMQREIHIVPASNVIPNKTNKKSTIVGEVPR